VGDVTLLSLQHDAPMSADRLFPLASVFAWLAPALLLILKAA
jgi:hypothetical protein